MKHSKPTITIFADASVYYDEKVAGWAGYVRGDYREPQWFQGPADFSSNVTSVELNALVQSIQLAVDMGYITSNDTHILLQSDCLNALEIIWSSFPNTCPMRKVHTKLVSKRYIKKDHAPYIQKLSGLLQNRQVVYLKHVKGHQKGIHARSWINEECDKRAKKEARKQLPDDIAAIYNSTNPL